ncbi:calcium-binding protein [Aestuariivirga sp.]|uniref:calcium-binding protein n=1 Tax=Aestuariivirga sp. TaxID=2650926 RepID=UPI003593893C
MTSFHINETFWGNMFLDPGEFGSIGQAGFFIKRGSFGPALNLTTSATVLIQGVMMSEFGGIVSSGGIVIIGSTGSVVTMGIGIDVQSSGPGRISNAGLIQSDTVAVSLQNETILTNSGDIVSLSGSGIVSTAGATLNLTNHGLIDAHEFGIEVRSETAVTFLNTGMVRGGLGAMIVDFGPGAQVTNRGTMDGQIVFGLGDDVFNGRYGVQTSVAGNVGNDVIIGGSGDDEFYGDSGNDRLVGNGGDDVLSGGFGLDTLNGGRGDDTLSGGASSDVFVFRRGDGHDRITDFADTRDKLDLSAFHFASVADVRALASNRPGGVLIDLRAEDGGTIFIDNFTLTSFGSGDLIL